MRISEKRRKWLTLRVFGKCVILSLALMTLAGLLKIAELVLTSNLSFIDRFILIVTILVVLTLSIWFLGLVNPEVMDAILKMLGQEVEKEEKKEELVKKSENEV